MSHYQEGKIKDVYSHNIEEELKKISELIDEYNFISMDTEFPGIVFPLNQNSQYTSKNIENFSRNPSFLNNKADSKGSQFTEANYKNIKMNVDNLKMIQMGITLANEFGEYPEEVSTWQFNFKFDVDKEVYLNESINLLEMAGIDFKKFNEQGIDVEYFAELFTTSGLILNENVKWVTFHGSYDFAYLMKALSNQVLPEDETLFNDMLSIYYCNFYDIRQMLKNVTWLKGSLSRISSDLDIKRIGQTHQAGSDSLVTSKVFFRLLTSFNDHIDLYGDKNKLFGFSYKVIDDFEWNANYNNYNNYNHYMGAIPNMGMSPSVHAMNLNNLNNLNNINNLSHIGKMPLNTPGINKSPQPNNMMYFQNMNGFNYQGTNLNPNMNMFFNNNAYNPLYQPQMDYGYMANLYNAPNGSLKPTQPISKESKFIS